MPIRRSNLPSHQSVLCAGPPKALHDLGHREDVIVGRAVIHVDAANAAALQRTGGAQQRFGVRGDLLRCTAQHAYWAKAQVEKSVRQGRGHSSHIRSPADVHHDRVEFGVGRRNLVQVVAAVVDSVGLDAPRHGLLDRKMQLAIAGGRDHLHRAVGVVEHAPIDLLHHAGGVIPPGPAIGRIRAALTIHDLQPLVMPQNFSSVKRRWLATMLPRSARKAAMVFTPSDPTSASVVSQLGVSENQVRTVPHGIEPHAPVPPDQVALVEQRYRLGDQTILYPAITYPHKDHVTLVQAFARLARDRPRLTLVLAGGAGPAEADVIAAIRASGVGDQIRRTGRIPWDDLHALYAAATVVAVPSRFEGFGAPALEAMSAGVPAVVANTTALPWVVGDAGLKVRPGDVTQWTAQLARVLDQPAVHATLAAAGRVRASHFTWDRAAAALASGYRAAAAIGETGAP